jgi:trehalose 6-phosphate phosphatase
MPAIGGHGAEMRVSPDTTPQPPRLPPLDAALKREFAAIAELGPGIILEDKGYSLALHYRLAPDKERVVRQAAARICAEHGGGSIELLPGKLVVEIKQTGVTKAKAVRELMRQPPFAGRRPIFLGDDVTDMSVFAIIPEFDGMSIFVGPHRPGVDFCFERPAEVRRWLAQLTEHGAVAPS